MDQVLKLHFFITIYLPLTLSLTLSTFPPTPCLCCYCYGSHASFAFCLWRSNLHFDWINKQHYVALCIKSWGKKDREKKSWQKESAGHWRINHGGPSQSHWHQCFQLWAHPFDDNVQVLAVHGNGFTEKEVTLLPVCLSCQLLDLLKELLH